VFHSIELIDWVRKLSLKTTRPEAEIKVGSDIATTQAKRPGSIAFSPITRAPAAERCRLPWLNRTAMEN
jgi:hypothetical protein